MQISLSTASLYIYPLRKTFELARRAGFDGVELVIGPEVEWRGAGYVRRLSQEYSLPILTVHPPLLGFPGWNKIQTSIEPYFDKAVQITRGVGAPLLVLHMPRAKSVDDRIGRGFIHTVVSARERMNGDGPKLALENPSKYSEQDTDYILRSLPELRGFADAHDFPMTLDTVHLGTWNLDLVGSLDYFDGRLMNVHFSDLRKGSGGTADRLHLRAYFRQHQIPGTGHLPLKEFLRALKSRGYDGPITYELSPLPLQLWSPHRVEEKLRECVEFVQAAIK